MAVQTLPAFTPDGSVGAAFGQVSSRVALPGASVSTDSLVVVTNYGSLPVFIALGDNTIAATIASSVVLAGQQRVYARGAATYIAGIVQGGNSPYNIQQQHGLVMVETGN
jgi:hypothetical protein